MANPSITAPDASVRPGIDRGVVVACAVAVGAAVLSGLAQAAGADRVAVLVPLILAAGLGMAWLALRRFTIFVAAILVLRSSLDSLKVSDGGTGILDPAALISVAFLVAGGIWLLVQPREDRAPASPFVAPLGVLALVAAVSTITAPSPASGLVDVAKLTTIVMMIAVLNQLCRTPRDATIVLGAAFASTVVPLAVAAYQGIARTGLHYSDTFGRTTGSFSHPNPFAIYLCFTILMLAGIMRYVHGRRRLLVLGLSAGCAVALYFTYTRSGWISTIVGLLVVGALSGRKIVSFIAVGVVVLGLAIPSVSTRFSDLQETTTQSGAAGNSLVWRFEYWRQALTLSDDPLLGRGLSAVKNEGTASKEPHNDFIRVFVETGVLGFAAYLWFLGRGMGAIRRSLRETRDGLWRGVVIGFGGAFCAYVLLSLVSNVITQLVLLWYLGAYAAAAVAAPRLAPRDEGPEPEPEPAAEAAPALA